MENRGERVITDEMLQEALRGVEVGILSRSQPELVDVIAEAAAQHEAFFSHTGPDWYLEGVKIGMRARDRRKVEAAELKGTRGHQRDEAILSMIRGGRI